MVKVTRVEADKGHASVEVGEMFYDPTTGNMALRLTHDEVFWIEPHPQQSKIPWSRFTGAVRLRPGTKVILEQE